MKIGIITLWDTQTNYGGVLQHFALQECLRSQGFDPFLIRYKHKSFLLKIKRIIKKILKKDDVKESSEIYNQRHFDLFRNQNFSMTDQIFESKKQLKQHFPNAEVFITGSDQVWNYNTFDGSGDPYFLEFGNDNKIKRIAYAASFGSINVRPKFIKYIAPKLQKFNAISLREENGVDICKLSNVTLSNLKVVCDPTILVNRETYDYIAEKNSKRNNYVFAYFIGWSTSIPKEKIVQFSSKNNFQIRYVPSQGMDEGLFDTKPYFATIPEWISLVRNANYMVTNSFHGTVFAILYHIPFVVFQVNGRKGRMNSRLTTLLEKINLSHHIYQNGPIEDILQDDINWKEIDLILDSWREESRSWLKNALKETNL